MKKRNIVMVKVVVFDLGGTLMQYVGMPYSWVSFYRQGVREIKQKYGCNVPEEAVEKTVQMLESFNPRVHYREKEYTAESIFTKAMEHWHMDVRHMDVPIADCVETFWSSLNLKAEIYPDTIPVLSSLREQGYTIAALTDLPSAMPDRIFKRDISELLEYFDYYVSSAVSGYRKPAGKGLQMIAEKYEVPVAELILIGDEEKDRLTAENAGCRFIPVRRLGDTGDGIKDLYELPALLHK